MNKHAKLRQLTVPTLVQTNMQLNECILIRIWFVKPGNFQSQH